jgi:hypothetical protein
MIKQVLFSLLILASLSNFSDAGINEVSDSICRMSNGDAFCTAWCYKEDEENYYLISAGHFKGGLDDKKITLMLTHGGQAKNVTATTLFWICEEGTATDISVVKLAKKDMDDYRPFKPLKLAKDSKALYTIWSYGCSNGAWPSAFKGVFLELNEKRSDIFNFNPPIIPGRSGSPVLNEDGTEVVGMAIMCQASVVTVNGKETEVPIFAMASNIESIRKLLEDNNLGE